MTTTPWTSQELWWLVQAWQETVSDSSDTGTKTRQLSSSQFTKVVYERFVVLSDGHSPRTIATIKHRLDVLQHSYEFIRSFLKSKETSGNLNWFALPKRDQRQLMKIAGGKRVLPIDKQVFDALDKFLKEKLVTAKQSNEIESESLEYSSEGDKLERGSQRRKKAFKNADTSFSSVKTPILTSLSALEEESEDFPSQKNDNYAKQKRRRVATKPPMTKGEVSDILERQSHALVKFLENRTKERIQELDRSRQEREADQRFWAAEAAKNRTLLRELFMDI